MLQNNILQEICAFLQDGKLVLMPTETIWGIVCDATNDEAVAQLMQLTNAHTDDGLVTMVANYEMLRQHAVVVHPKIDLLLQYHTRPVTVVYPNVKGISPLVSKSNQYAIRIANNNFCTSLIEEFQKPIVATAAAVKGTPYPEYFGKISSDILQGVQYIVRLNQEDKTSKTPSPIVCYNETTHELEFIRE